MKNFDTTPQSAKTIQALWRLEKLILDSLDFKKVVQKIVDSLLQELGYLDLGYRIIVLTLINKNKNVLQRISLSQTREARRVLKASAVPFHDIEIPLNAKNNFLIKTIHDKKPIVIHSWPLIFSPILTPKQALHNQKAAGIKTSMLYPVIVRDKVIGVLIFSLVKQESEVSAEEKELLRGFTDIVGLAVQNARLYTKLSETSDKLSLANQKLKELDRLKDDFVSVASHELRTPMTAIKSYLWMALNGKGGPILPKEKFYLDRAYNSTDRLIKLVNDMLNISRIESGRMTYEMKAVNIVELSKEVIDEITPRSKELGVTITVNGGNSQKTQFTTLQNTEMSAIKKKLSIYGEENDEQKSIPMVLADTDKIKEVLFNLVGNSLKFTNTGGSITLNFAIKGDFVETSVSDTGVGMERTDIEKLFRKFGLMQGSYQTTKKASQGTGLGLYISKLIIETHGGNIQALSEGSGKGSTFSFTLPLYTKKGREEKQNLSSGKEKIDVIHSGL